MGNRFLAGVFHRAQAQKLAVERITQILALCMIANLPASAENLLVNPGFDSLDVEGRPEHWDLFVMPMEGAHGEIAPSTTGAPFAVKLHNPETYPREPANNWSQTIVGEFGGQTLRVSGSIKTEDATEAAIWLQCWTRNPPRVLLSESTSVEFPTYGTLSWSPVSMRVDVPEATEFLVLRCVLKGRGTAWFDAIAIDTDDANAPPLPGSKMNQDGGASAQDVLDANAAIQEVLGLLTETNSSLITEIAALQEELVRLREEISVRNDQTSMPTAVPRPGETPRERVNLTPIELPEAQPPKRYGHPLVPVGYKEPTNDQDEVTPNP